jgi:ankyrin repeat protein
LKTRKTTNNSHPDLAQLVESGDSARLHAALKNVDTRLLSVAGEPLVFQTRDILMIRSLVLAGAPVDVPSSSGISLLHHILFGFGASYRGFSSNELLALVASQTQKIDAKDGDGFTPLYLACKMSNFGAVELLCRHGADINLECTERRMTPLFAAIAPTAASKDQNRIVAHLIALGAKLELYERGMGWTPLMCATFMRSVDNVRALVEAGANTRAISLGLDDYPKETACDIAKRMGYTEMIDYLDARKNA